MNRYGGKLVLLDPDDIFVGTCNVCHNTVKAKRTQLVVDGKSPKSAELGAWADIPYVECLACKARSEELIKKAGTKKPAVGTRIYMARETK